MAANNEELMYAFVRAGRIMQHLDGEGPHRRHCCKRDHGPEGHGHGHDPEGFGHGHGPEGHGHGCHGGHGGHGGRKHGRHGQARALSLIGMQEGITQKDLAFLLGIRPQSAGEMLAKLEEYGLVERRKSESDARAIQLFLTEDGRTHAQEIDRMRKVVAEDVFSALTDEEKDELSSILAKLQVELDKYRPQHHPEPAEEDEKE